MDEFYHRWKLIGGENSLLGKIFVGENIRHLTKISSLIYLMLVLGGIYLMSTEFLL